MVSCTLFGMFDVVKEKSRKLSNEPKLDEDSFILRYNLVSEQFYLQKVQ